MRNVIILGSGRSGTSMVAGTLAKAGYFMGANLLLSRDANPKGFFEDAEINAINEAILARVVSKRPWLIGKWFFRDRPLLRQRWLSRVSVGKKIMLTPKIAKRIENAVKNTPYCFKDPRFSYTLPVWRPFLGDKVFIAVFRDPATTAHSMLKECRSDANLHSLYIDFRLALQSWSLMYRHILETHRKEGEWMFIHYDQAFKNDALDRMERFTGAHLDRSFPDRSLARTYSDEPVPEEMRKLYQRLCDLAGYAP
jgi:hypothetical protein